MKNRIRKKKGMTAAQKILEQQIQLEDQARKLKTERLIMGGLFYILKKADIFPSQTDILAAIAMAREEGEIDDEVDEEEGN